MPQVSLSQYAWLLFYKCIYCDVLALNTGLILLLVLFWYFWYSGLELALRFMKTLCSLQGSVSLNLKAYWRAFFWHVSHLMINWSCLSDCFWNSCGSFLPCIWLHWEIAVKTLLIRMLWPITETMLLSTVIFLEPINLKRWPLIKRRFLTPL